MNDPKVPTVKALIGKFSHYPNWRNMFQELGNNN
jgi:hypothetical protein